jgi:hypothetical protein
MMLTTKIMVMAIVMVVGTMMKKLMMMMPSHGALKLAVMEQMTMIQTLIASTPR